MAASKTETYQQQAYAFVKAQILNLTLKPAQYITDTQVSKDLSISRTPVREAFRQLEHEGLLVGQPRRGWKVYTLSLEDIHEIFDIKEALEIPLVKHAAQCQNKTLRKQLRGALAEMKRANQAHDYERWRDADKRLHHVIHQMHPNRRAERILQNLNDQWQRVRVGLMAMEGHMKRSTREHEALVQCIVKGDGDRAGQLMQTHLTDLRKEIVSILTNLVLPFAQHGV